MTDRRSDDRRDSERREFREQEGRRDPSARPRRLGSRRYLAPLVVVGLIVAILFAYRVAVVAPRIRASAAVEDTRLQLQPLLSSARLSLLALPGLGEPGPGPLAVDQRLLDPNKRALVVGLIERLQASIDDSAVLVQGNSVVASAHLLLGDERAARIAYELVLARGDELQRQQASLSLGVLAVRSALRQDSSQDRMFAFEHALSYFERVVDQAEGLFLLDALFNQGVTLVLLGHTEAAERVLARLPTLSGGRQRQTSLRLWVATGAAVSLLLPSEGLPTIDAQEVL